MVDKPPEMRGAITAKSPVRIPSFVPGNMSVGRHFYVSIVVVFLYDTEM